MIYRWFWRCSSDPNAHSSFTVAPAEPEECKTFRRPADGRKMKRDHPNCWTAQLNTILKNSSCSCVCVCVCEQYRWSGLTLIINHQLSHPESRWCGTIQPGSGFICSSLLLSTLVRRCDSSKTFFTRRHSSFLRWGKESRGFFSAQQPREKFSVLTVVFLFNVLKKRSEDAQEYWKESGEAQVTMSKPQHAWIYYQYINIYTNMGDGPIEYFWCRKRCSVWCLIIKFPLKFIVKLL